MTALEKTLRWIVLAGFFALPFIVFIAPFSGSGKFLFDSQDYFFPFITGKNFAFRIIIEIMAGAWLALALVRPEYRPYKSALTAVFAVFVALIGLSDALGAVPFKSFWSNFERMDGWVTLAHLFALILVATSVMTPVLWRRYWRLIAGISAVVGFHALLQLFGFAAIGQGGAAGLSARLDATFGNPIYLAVFMLFSVCIVALLWAEDWRSRPAGRRLPISILWGAVLLLDVLVLLFTGTRGATLGLIGGALLTGILIALFRPAGPEGSTARRVAIGLIAAIIVSAGIFWIARDSALVQRVAFLRRLAAISLSDAALKARFINWNTAWQGVKERPILGWGQENFAIVFDKYYDPRTYASEQWFDRVHNVVFDWLVAGGFLGLLAYLSIFAFALRALWRGESSPPERSAPRERRFSSETPTFSLAEKSIITGLLAAYFVQNLTVFDNITSYLLFASVIAYIAGKSAEARSSPRLLPERAIPQSTLPIIAAAAVILVWAAAWGINQKAMAQNKMLLQGISPQGNISKNLEYLEKAISFGSFGTQEAREQLSQAAMQLAGANVPDTIKKGFYEATVREMNEQQKASPLDARFPLFLGIVQGAYGDHNGAKQMLERAHELSPRKQTILFELAKNAQSRGDASAMMNYLKEAFELEHEYDQARIYYAAALIRAGQDAAADDLLAPLIERGAGANTEIAAAYVARGRYDKIVEIWKARTAFAPDDIQAHFTLAAAYNEMGRQSEAIAALQEAARLNPSARAEIDALLQQIRSGTLK